MHLEQFAWACDAKTGTPLTPATFEWTGNNALQSILETAFEEGTQHPGHTLYCHGVMLCQSAFKTDPLSASKIDPLDAEQARRCVVSI